MKKNLTLGLNMNDVPMWLFKEFISNVKNDYNDIYWVKLMDIVRKAKSYDYLISQGIINEEPSEEVIDEEETGEVLTMGGLRK